MGDLFSRGREVVRVELAGDGLRLAFQRPATEDGPGRGGGECRVEDRTVPAEPVEPRTETGSAADEDARVRDAGEAPIGVQPLLERSRQMSEGGYRVSAAWVTDQPIQPITDGCPDARGR
jgi:hypothetical protein